MVAARRLTVCMVATACLSLTANLWVRNQRATAAAVRQEQRWSALSERLDLAALSTPILALPPPPPSPAAAPSPPASSPALSSAAPQSDGGQPRKDSAAAASLRARLALASERAAAAKRAAAKRAAIGRAATKRAAAERAAVERAAAARPAFAPGQAAATHDLALRSSRGANATLAEVDTEDGVRHGSRCRDESDKRTHMRPRCPDASDIVAELDAEAAREAAAGEAAAGQAAARAPVSRVTSPRSPVTIAARASVRACASLCGPVRACVRRASARGASPATTAYAGLRPCQVCLFTSLTLSLSLSLTLSLTRCPRRTRATSASSTGTPGRPQP